MIVFIDPKAGPTLGDLVDLPWYWWVIIAAWSAFLFWILFL